MTEFIHCEGSLAGDPRSCCDLAVDRDMERVSAPQWDTRTFVLCARHPDTADRCCKECVAWLLRLLGAKITEHCDGCRCANKRTSVPLFRVQYDPGSDRVIDDMFVPDAVSVHLERMDNGFYWIGIERADGTTLHIDIYDAHSSRSKLNARDRDASPPARITSRAKEDV
jgi:hypothetical protein